MRRLERGEKAGESPVTGAVRAARSQGRPAVVPFLTGGYPSLERFWTALEDLCESGADIIEIGAPFSDPVADGPVVAAASQKALDGGATLAYIVEGLKERDFATPMVLMSYANPLAQYGWARASGKTALERLADSLSILASDLAETPVKGVIVPDVPFEEAGPFYEAFSAEGLCLIPLVGPNTDSARMALYKPMAGGYVYAVSVLGTTGVREGLPKEAADTIRRAREVFSLPVALGFGIKDPAQLAALGADPDAVIIGSALLRHLGEGGSCRDFMRPWTQGRAQS
ncbi:MAG: tryptophan synthase subunit alpha [Deltaproteobacteria bacterium]|jgi:tryptophan synthase alpha chain|nr:tryptophan synthase subunit alpha [Deltaproteobacteria bacterium]